MRFELTPLELAELLRPGLPPEVKTLTCDTNAVHLSIDASAALPKALRAAAPDIRLSLEYQDSQAGVVMFKVITSVFSLPATRVVSLLINLFDIPQVDGVHIDVPKGSPAPRLRLDLNQLVGQAVQGITVKDVWTQDSLWILSGTVRDFKAMPTPKPATSS